MSEARQDDKAIPGIDELAKPVAPIAVGTAQAHELEPQRLSDHVHLNWWSPRTKSAPGHVAINYSAHGAVELRDWPKAIADVVRRHSGRYVIVIGPPLPARDNKATKVREIVLTAGALWKNAEPGQEEETRLALEKEIFAIQEFQSFSLTPDEDAKD